MDEAISVALTGEEERATAEARAMLENKRATQVQAIQRGRMGRNSAREQLERRQQELQADRAASQLQAMQRGRAGRREAEGARERRREADIFWDSIPVNNLVPANNLEIDPYAPVGYV